MIKAVIKGALVCGAVFVTTHATASTISPLAGIIFPELQAERIIQKPNTTKKISDAKKEPRKVRILNGLDPSKVSKQPDVGIITGNGLDPAVAKKHTVSKPRSVRILNGLDPSKVSKQPNVGIITGNGLDPAAAKKRTVSKPRSVRILNGLSPASVIKA